MRRLILIGAGGTVVLVLVLAQLFLPGIAAQHIRDQLSAHGTVEHVEVDAFPAIELLWHQADKVVVRMGATAPRRPPASARRSARPPTPTRSTPRPPRLTPGC